MLSLDPYPESLIGLHDLVRMEAALSEFSYNLSDRPILTIRRRIPGPGG